MADDSITASTSPSSPRSRSSPRSHDSSRLDLRLKSSRPSSTHMPRVVIIGGGYAGARCAFKLGKEFPTWDIVLIDSKDYFENTIAVLTTVTHVDISSSVAAALKIVAKHESYLAPNTRFYREMVKNITATKVILDTQTIYYDYLILACGTSYCSGIKSSNLTSDFRLQALSRDASDLAKSDSVLIVGGGLVGVELASDIIQKYPNKEVTLATAGSRLLDRMKPNVSDAASKWLLKHGVKIFYNERVIQSKRDAAVFKLPTTGTRTRPDKAYWCTGFTPNSQLLQKNFPHSLSDRGYVKVNGFLQMEGVEAQNIFVGDLADLPEEKMAERASAHGAFVVKQMKLLRKGAALTKPYKSPKKPPGDGHFNGT